MSLRKLLENPSGGQLISLFMAVLLAVAAEGVQALDMYWSVTAGTAININEILAIVILGIPIWRAANYVRKHHGAR